MLVGQRGQPAELKVYGPRADLMLHALDWPGTDDALPIVWLHGWLDNAASFSPLIPLLSYPGRSLALDFPGHGYSSWLGPRQPYLLWETPFIVAEFIELALGRGQPYVLAGHSMGAAIAPLLAGIASDPCIEGSEQAGGCRGLILLDGCGPFFATDDIRERLTLYHQGLARINRRSTPPVYPDLGSAVEARLRHSDMTEAAARLIVSRGTRATAAGCVFRHDPKLKLPTAHRFAEAQVASFFRHIHCPVLLLSASAGLLASEDIAGRVALLADISAEVIPGGHHFHMESPELTAAAIDAWLSRHQPSAVNLP